MPSLHPPAAAPSLPALELERLRNNVRAQLFGLDPHRVDAVQIARYRVSRCVGRGGMGIVYLARDDELDRDVAIKLLRPELSRDSTQQLQSEARALARLSHPNVVTVFDVGEHQGQRFIAMEYVEGRTLRRWLEERHTLREVLEAFVQAGRGLAAAHGVGLVHRDFKPDNVLMGDDGRARVLDFGLARPPHGVDGRVPQLPASAEPSDTVFTIDGEIVGTPAYMAPELHLGRAADHRSDQFAFGVALYQAVHGERPFEGDDPRTVALSIVRGIIPPTRSRFRVPSWLSHVLERTLSVEASGRFASMSELLGILERELARKDRPDEALADAVAPLAPERRSVVASSIPASSGVGATSALATPTPIPEAEYIHGLRSSFAVRSSVGTELGAMQHELLVREVERLEGSPGKVERLGASTTWSGKELEVQIDPAPDATHLLLWRRLDRRIAKSRQGTLFGGVALGLLSAPIVVEGLNIDEYIQGALIPLVLIMSVLIWIRLLRWLARRAHVERVDRDRARLDYMARRLVSLANLRALDDAPEAELAPERLTPGDGLRG